MGPLCTSGVPSCLPDPGGLLVAVDDTASRFRTTPPTSGEQPVFRLYSACIQPIFRLHSSGTVILLLCAHTDTMAINPALGQAA